MHRPPEEGNFCDEYVNALQPAIVQDYNRHMRYVDKSGRIKTVTPLADAHGNEGK
jgi:hypothetical protein